MSVEINKAFSQKFRDAFIHLVQQKGSRLREYVRSNTDVVGKYDDVHVNVIGTVGVERRSLGMGINMVISSNFENGAGQGPPFAHGRSQSIMAGCPDLDFGL